MKNVQCVICEKEHTDPDYALQIYHLGVVIFWHCCSIKCLKQAVKKAKSMGFDVSSQGDDESQPTKVPKQWLQ